MICYIDDILITGPTDQVHLQNLRAVLKKLKEHDNRAKLAKCAIMKSSVQYLGHKVSAEGLQPLESKTDAIVRAPEPQNLQQLRGLLNYYSKFIPNLTTMTKPLNHLLNIDVKWKWRADCAEAFVATKNVLVSSKVLVHYDPKLPISLAGDASAYGLGAVISRTLPDRSERPIAYA